MSQVAFRISLNSRLVEPARELYLVSRVGDDRTGPNQTFEAYLADLVTVALVERLQNTSRSAQDAPGATKKRPARVEIPLLRETAF